ncbi:hypothetical protein K435DRAFT_577116, partial [Dendrothele bispora CBS 962.96]
CHECLSDLQSPIELPPTYALANNMWIGKVPVELKKLTFPEQLLIAQVYPRVFVFKLYPKKSGGSRNNLQRGMRGNVSSYALDQTGISSMLVGKMMPQRPEILASVITVTYIGKGKLPKGWLYSTFRVRRRVVADALAWLKCSTPEVYGSVEIDMERLSSLPEDGVPEEI